jgi:membrane protein implicated in regulation of membrane protease activity
MMLGTTVSYLLAAYGGYWLAFAAAIPLVVLSLFVVQRLYSRILQHPHWQKLQPE